MKTQTGYTYNDKRMCPCGKKIPDQWHKNIKYCPAFIDENGKKIVHKHIYTAEPKKLKNQPYKALFNYYKRSHQNLISLWRRKTLGKDIESILVTNDELKAYLIDLSRPVQLLTNQNKKIILYYIDFAIEQIDQTTFKIFKHGLQY